MTDIITPPGQTRPPTSFGDPRLPQRFWDKVQVTEQDCWAWTAFRARNGYGQYTVNARRNQAHRVAYSVLVGPIPDGLHIDHLCRVRECVNPAHLEAVTQQENNRRAGGPEGYRQAVCRRGHRFSDEDAYIDPRGRRQCGACRKIRNAEYRARKRAKNGGAA